MAQEGVMSRFKSSNLIASLILFLLKKLAAHHARQTVSEGIALALPRKNDIEASYLQQQI
jgi:hypothetical protein